MTNARRVNRELGKPRVTYPPPRRMHVPRGYPIAAINQVSLMVTLWARWPAASSRTRRPWKYCKQCDQGEPTCTIFYSSVWWWSLGCARLIMRVIPALLRRTDTTPKDLHTGHNPISAKRLHRHYSVKPALPNRLHRGTLTSVSVISALHNTFNYGKNRARGSRHVLTLLG